MKTTKTFKNIDEYIQQFPDSVQEKLNLIRKLVHVLAPDAVEKISYGMPAFYLNGNLLYFAGYKNHIGFYPTGSGVANFQKEISKYKNSKGAVQFPLDKKLPITLIKKIIKFRVNENIYKDKSERNHKVQRRNKKSGG